MATQSVETDMGFGLAVVFAVVTGLGAVAMLAAPGQVAKAWGFAAAMIAAALAVVALHVY